ncbi:MAG: ribonuclease HII [Gammaproteobacteria bacterium]|nr:ribonuclease HII [Gammaproteobacteria bacterium]
MRSIWARHVAGLDEAGRGPLAGPVVAAAVVLDPNDPIPGVADSKTLTPAKREHLCRVIKERALCWALGRAECHEIDQLNILQSTLLAMSRALGNLPILPDLALVDGNRAPRLPCQVQTVVKGDAVVPAISAASIVAKVSRDQEMQQLDCLYPGYGLAHNKGYPTADHLKALQTLGVTAIHRRSYAPVYRLL